MPTIFFYLGMRFHFYSNDHLPIHVHVSVDNSEACFQVFPNINLVENRGLKQHHSVFTGENWMKICVSMDLFQLRSFLYKTEKYKLTKKEKPN